MVSDVTLVFSFDVDDVVDGENGGIGFGFGFPVDVVDEVDDVVVVNGC